MTNYGWAGTILDVDLSSGGIEKRPLEDRLRRQYLGGRGINSRILYDEVKPGTDACSPENVLIFGTGPLGGTIAPSPNRMNISARSPMYKGIGTSNVGGRFAADLKHAGYDHIVIRGRAEEPVYLWIDDDHVTLESAKHLWGQMTWETDEKIREELGDPEIKVAAIGPAGEKLVGYASVIINKYRAAGQTGMGAVMGSKNLKVVAVRGTRSIRVAHSERLLQLTREITQRIMKNKNYYHYSVHGTPGTMLIESEAGSLAVKNYNQTGHWRAAPDYGPDALFQYYTRDKACQGCPLHCSHFFVLKDGPYKGEKGGGLEAGATMGFGAFLDNPNAESVFKCTNLCNQYGMDTLELPMAIAAAMEWYEKGIISREDLDGKALNWGDHEGIVDMVHRIGKREGFGDVLALGAIHAAQKIGGGAEACVTHCKGMTVGVDDCRILKSNVLNYVTATIPSHVEEGMMLPMSPKRAKAMFGTENTANSLSYKDKAVPTVYFQKVCMMTDILEICKFISGWMNQEVSFKEAADLFSAATGLEMGPEELESAAERVQDLERAFAVREGMTREDDHMHGKLMIEPVQTGPFKGQTLDPEGIELMLDEYYEARGWDKETGIPTRAKLESVGLKKVADELAGMGKFPPTMQKIEDAADSRRKG